MQDRSLFLSLIRIALGRNEILSYTPSPKEWVDVHAEFESHAILGVGFSAIRMLLADNDVEARMSTSLRYLSDQLLYQWAAEALFLEQSNDIKNEESKIVSAWFESSGCKTCILKGQSINLHYPKAIVRAPGDIDLWVMPNDDDGGHNRSLRERRNSLVSICKKSGFPFVSPVYHHVDCIVKGIQVELHFTPSWMNTPWYNKRLQSFFDEEFSNRCVTAHVFYAPSLRFEIVFSYVHIFRHILSEGIGMKQFCDLFFLIDSLSCESVELTRDIASVLKSIGLARFASGVSYILVDVFNLPEDRCIFPVDQVIGSVLLKEILESGNFGVLDGRYPRQDHSICADGLLNFRIQILRNFSLIHYFPQEVLWNIPFRIVHYCWRKLRGWR